MISGSLIADVPASPRVLTEQIPGLPPELQPGVGDVLLASPLWPWQDLGAKGIPEQWLYMSRHTQGVIALLTVQTPNGPKLVHASSEGSIVSQPSLPTNLITAVVGPNQIGVSGKRVLIAGKAGQRISVYAYSVDMHETMSADPSPCVALASSVPGNPIAADSVIVFEGGNNTTRQWEGEPSSLLLPVGHELGLFNLDSIVHMFSGSVYATQG
jgi:hypothetical protein